VQKSELITLTCTLLQAAKKTVNIYTDSNMLLALFMFMGLYTKKED
jgi:hypothetical protein